METKYLIIGYGFAFLMASTSMLIELSNRYGSYFQFTMKSYYSYLYCFTYGLVGFGGFWLYQAGIMQMQSEEPQIDNILIKSIISGILIGWSAKGLVDTPILPAKSSDSENSEGFRLGLIINLLFKDADNNFNLIIAGKQHKFFTSAVENYKENNHGLSDVEIRKKFGKNVYDYLDLHPNFGDGDDLAKARFNTFMTQLASEKDLERSFKYAYRNLGYKIFKKVMK